MTKRLSRARPILGTAFVASYLGAIVVKLSGGGDSVAFAVGIPALVLSGWAALGHLITLDDDYPGNWSNPESDKGFWRRSLLALLGKLGLFGVLLLVLAA